MEPLFAALERRGIAYEQCDLKQAFGNLEPPLTRLYFNQRPRAREGLNEIHRLVITDEKVRWWAGR